VTDVPLREALPTLAKLSPDEARRWYDHYLEAGY